jgi:hypothetical protein
MVPGTGIGLNAGLLELSHYIEGVHKLNNHLCLIQASKEPSHDLIIVLLPVDWKLHKGVIKSQPVHNP